MKLFYSYTSFFYNYLNKTILCLIILVFCHNKLNAQQFNNWYFHNFNGLTFNTNPPSFLPGGQITNTQSSYSTASISDNNGRLLFYSDGERVWNRNHQLMPNGFGLLGGDAQINTALIIPFPNDTSKYYLFTSRGMTYRQQPDTCQYNYSVIDMQLDGGLGDVTNKNTFIRFFANEKMTAIPNANGNDVWWICRDWTNHFYSYKITCQGFQHNNPVVSEVGNNIYFDDNLLSAGEIKASPNGKYIASCYRDYFEIYRFDNATGKLSDPVLIPIYGNPGGAFYGLEFSPDSKLLYATGVEVIGNTGHGIVKQYNLSNYDSTSISNSAVNLSSNYATSGLQLGPDNKIYHITIGYDISVINNPNIPGTGCNFQPAVITLPNPGFRRFPYAYVNLIAAQNVQVNYTVAADCRTVTFTGKTFIKGNNLTFKWKWGEPPPVSGTPGDSATQVVTSQGDTTYTTIVHTYPPGQDTFFVNLAVNSDTLCGTGRAGIRVIVKPPKPTANFGFTAACNDLTVSFTDNSLLNTNPSITHQYAWKPALSPPSAYTNYSTLPNNSFTFPAYDSFDVRLIVTSSISCVNQDTIVKRIVLKAKPVAGCTSLTNCGSLQASFSSSATVSPGSLAQQEYYAGNNLIGTGAGFVYNFPAYGSYTIKQVVKSNFGCISDTFLLPVIIRDKPLVNVTTPRDSVCNNSLYTINANATVSASTITNYVWLKNNILTTNNTSSFTDNNPAGTYTYKMVATSAQGCRSDTALKTITVVSKPVASVNATNNCGSKSIAITASGQVLNDVISSHYIIYGDGNVSAVNPDNTTYTYAGYGTYQLKYVLQSSIGCASDTAYQTIEVKDKPVASIIYNNNACTNTDFVLTGNASVNAAGINSYRWFKNGILLPANSNTLTDNNPAGTYTYKLVVSSNRGCNSDTAVQVVRVDDRPRAIFTAENNCVGKTITITNNSIPNNPSATYLWTTSDGQTSTALVPSFAFNSSGSKTILLKVSSPNGSCTDNTSQTITIDAYPVAAFDITEACVGKTVAITNSSTGSIASYAWQASNALQSSSMVPSFVFNTPGNYSIKLEVATANNCSDEFTRNIQLQRVPLVVRPALDTMVTVNQPVQLSAAGAVTYNWQPVTYLTNASSSSPVFKAAVPGIYPLTIEAITAQGCKSSASISIKVFAGAEYLYVPNAFTPNADGLNDNFTFTCAGLQSLTFFRVYNRYGQIVYQQNNCGTVGWDGTLKGIKQPGGTYVYQWQGIAFNGKAVSGKGWVVLVR